MLVSPAKGCKDDIILAVHFIRGGVSTVVHKQQDLVFQLCIKISGHMHSEKRKQDFGFTVKILA